MTYLAEIFFGNITSFVDDGFVSFFTILANNKFPVWRRSLTMSSKKSSLTSFAATVYGTGLSQEPYLGYVVVLWS